MAPMQVSIFSKMVPELSSQRRMQLYGTAPAPEAKPAQCTAWHWTVGSRWEMTRTSAQESIKNYGPRIACCYP